MDSITVGVICQRLVRKNKMKLRDLHPRLKLWRMRRFKPGGSALLYLIYLRADIWISRDLGAFAGTIFLTFSDYASDILRTLSKLDDEV
jgi:hypothetical protein